MSMLFKNLKYKFFVFLVSISTQVIGQEIPFGSYSSAYEITPLSTGQILNFGTIVQNEGMVSVPIEEATVVSVEGVRYLDITVDVQIDFDFLFLNGNDSCVDSSCRIPFTLKAAYSNRSDAPNVNQAILMTGSPGLLSARFPIRDRGNTPPGPPPTPVYEGFNPTIYNKTAYIYLYGDLTVGNQNAGPYSYDIDVTINYE